MQVGDSSSPGGAVDNKSLSNGNKDMTQAFMFKLPDHDIVCEGRKHRQRLFERGGTKVGGRQIELGVGDRAGYKNTSAPLVNIC